MSTRLKLILALLFFIQIAVIAYTILMANNKLNTSDDVSV